MNYKFVTQIEDMISSFSLYVIIFEVQENDNLAMQPLRPTPWSTTGEFIVQVLLILQCLEIDISKETGQ